MALATRCRLGRYEVLSPLGAGGMGEVYRARDEKLGREVALKILPAEYAADPARLKRFEQEARAIGALNHPNILTVHDVGVDGGTTYIVTELLEGETLREVLGRGGLSTQKAIALGAEIAHGLSAAHAKGILHRDLKPQNLFLTSDARLKILDFGLAKLRPESQELRELTTEPVLTQPGAPLGTLGYMSPEQLRGEAVDARSDVFALGAVLYEMLSGKSPFRRHSAADTMSAILNEDPPRLTLTGRGIPPALDGLVRRCLEKRPEDRFHSAHDLALALQSVLVSAGAGQAAAEEPERGPYPGLASFTERDAPFFFGREEEVAALWEKLRTRRLLAVIGPSGAGKTSFMRAGVIPAKPRGWGAVVFTPGRAPLKSLARALAPELAHDPEALRSLVSCDDEDVLLSLVRKWRQHHVDAVLAADQFEELFTQNPPAVQATFTALIGRLAAEGGVHVLLSLRDDFLMRCHEQGSLAPVFSDLTPLLPLRGEALRRALVEPARKQGFAFEDEALVEEMLGAVEGERGALPLVAFAAARLWEKRDPERRVLTRSAHDEIGGVLGALAQHAESTLERTGPERRPIVREIFRNLVTAHGTRAAIDREELLSALPDREAGEDVLAQLIDARLLVSYEVEGTGGPPSQHRIELVHESLLGNWPRLVRWQAQDADGALLRDQLKQAAHLWEEKGRSPDLLWTGSAEREFELWRERYPGKLTALEEDFSEAMVGRARRRRRLRQLVAGSLLGASLLVAAVTGALWRQSEAARDQAQAEALRAEASAIVALGRAELGGYPLASLAYARKSLEVADTPGGRRLAVDALWRAPTARILPLGEHVSWFNDFSPDGRWLAGYVFDGRLLLVPDDGGPVRAVPGPPKTGLPPLIRFLPDGSTVATHSKEEAVVRVWDVLSGREIRRFEPEPPGRAWPPGEEPRAGFSGGFMLRLAPTPDGLLFSWWPSKGPSKVPTVWRLWPYDGGRSTIVGSLPAGADGAIADAAGARVLLRRGRRLSMRELRGADGVAVEQGVATLDDIGSRRYLGFTPPGDRAFFGAVAGGMGRVWVWPLTPDLPPEPRVFSMPNPDGNFLPVWDPNGTRLAWGSSAEHAVRVWDLAGPPDAAPTLLRRPDMSVAKRAVFSPVGDWLVVAHQAVLTFWSLAGPRPRILAGHAENVSRLVFTPDSRGLVSCALDGVRLWPLVPRHGTVRRIAEGFQGWCMDASVAPDGGRLVLVGSNGGWLAEPLDGPGRWLEGGTPDYAYLLAGAAWDASGSRVALASSYSYQQTVFLLDVTAGHRRSLRLAPPGETGKGYDWGVQRIAFAPDGRLVTGGSGGVRWLDPGTGASQWLWRLPREIDAWTATSADGRRLAAAALRREKAVPDHGAVLVDLASGTVEPVRSHGSAITAVALDATGAALVTGDAEGVVRAGRADGGEPHRLCCHAGSVQTIAVSPDGKWIASASGGEIRLWPMPDVMKPPLHTLPYAELMAKLYMLSNLQVVEDATSSTGYRLEVGPFPGWRDVPTW